MKQKDFRWKGCLLGVILVCVVLAICTEDAQAIPVFARKYKTSCATCHEAFPRLNGAGEAFRLNGFQFADDELYIKDEPVELGDEAYKRLWPQAIWPSDIPGMPPIALRVINDFPSDIGGNDRSRTNFDFPHEIELFAAGAFGESLSYFVELEWEGGVTSTDAWLGFNDLFGTENTFNLKAGNIMGSDAGLFTHRDGRRFTRNDYLYADWRLPYPTQFTDNTDNVRNTYRVRSGQAGVELNGFNRSWYYAVGVLNGDSSLSEKDFYGQLAYKIGGVGFDGSAANLGDELGGTVESWQDDSVTLSGWVHSGKRLVSDDGSSANEQTDDFWRAGFGALWRTGDLQLGGGFFAGENDNPYGTLTDGVSEGVDSHGWFVEATHFTKPWLIPSLRYEVRNLDMPSGGVGSLGGDQDLGRLVASAKMLLRANVSLTLEGRFATTDEGRSSGTNLSDENMLWARLDFAF